MKIKKIASLCSQAGMFDLLNKTDRGGVVTQWLGDGCAFYPLLGAPMMDKDSLCTMFDVTGKKRDNMIVRCDEMSEKMNVDDLNSGDIRLEPEGVSICHEGLTILPLRGANRTFCIQEKYLEPLDDERELLELYSRPMGEETHVVVKAGMMIRAVIAPFLVKDKLADKLETIARACKAEAVKEKDTQGRQNEKPV